MGAHVVAGRQRNRRQRNLGAHVVRGAQVVIGALVVTGEQVVDGAM
jgi:hypothetical protein